MDIKPTLDTLQQMAVNKIGAGLGLKLNQIIEAKVIDNQLILNALTLKVADQTLSLQTQQPLNLQPGQPLQLQVVKLLPTPEFKVLHQQSGPSTADNLSPLLKLISPPSTQPSTVSAAALPTALSPDNLVKGQQIAVRVVEIINHKVTLQLLPFTTGNGAIASPLSVADKTLLTLDLKQLSLLLPTPASVPQMTAQSSSEILLLQVIKSGKTPVFALSFPPTDNSGKIADALKQLLPIQDSPLPLLNQLVQSLPQLGRDASVAETLRQLAQEILRNLPQQSQLSDPLRLKQAVQDSGLFLERKLLELLTGQTEIDLKSDFKLKLLQLVQLLGQEPAAAPADAKLLAEILQKTQGALAKLTLDQLNALPKEDLPKQGWAVELPFFHNGKADKVHIEIERDRSGSPEQQQKNWAVSIVITPPNLGTIRCKISCYDGSVNTRFTSDAAVTVELINTHLDYLKRQFEDNGLTTGFMDAQQGLAAPANSPQTPLTHLLSEKA